MPPIRRYLRISKHSVLECRIYLDNPSDTRWLLNSRDPVLPQIFAAIRPLVLPKLREENERLFARKKGHPVKDVIAEDEFEVALFLRESRTRHSLLTRQKTFEEPDDGGRKNELNRNNTADAGIVVDSDEEGEEGIDLHNIPAANDQDDTMSIAGERAAPQAQSLQEPDEDEKKLRFRTNYESFNIYGWVLCLLVTRKGDATRQAVSAEPKGQVLMEEWMSTQAQGGLDEEGV